jgi:hypothetical protein
MHPVVRGPSGVLSAAVSERWSLPLACVPHSCSTAPGASSARPTRTPWLAARTPASPPAPYCPSCPLRTSVGGEKKPWRPAQHANRTLITQCCVCCQRVLAHPLPNTSTGTQEQCRRQVPGSTWWYRLPLVLRCFWTPTALCECLWLQPVLQCGHTAAPLVRSGCLRVNMKPLLIGIGSTCCRLLSMPCAAARC